MNVPDFLNPRKESGVGFYLGVIMVLVAITSFGLGRLSIESSKESRLRVLYPEGMAEARLEGSGEGVASPAGAFGAEMGTSSKGEIVASKSGSKYHFTWCSGAKSIKEENKLYFSTVTQARAAGYEPASNCKGLQ